MKDERTGENLHALETVEVLADLGGDRRRVKRADGRTVDVAPFRWAVGEIVECFVWALDERERGTAG